jgi:hypothetical protein
MPTALDMHDREAAFLDRQQMVPVRSRIPVLKIKIWIREGRPADKDAVPQAVVERLVDEWMRKHKPDMVLGFNNAFYWLLKNSGWAVPDAVGFTNLWISEPTAVGSGLCLSPDEVGRRAVEWLDSLLRVGERGLPTHPATMAVNLVWRDGEKEKGCAST